MGQVILLNKNKCEFSKELVKEYYSRLDKSNIEQKELIQALYKHLEKVKEISGKFIHELDLTEKEANIIECGAILHDICKYKYDENNRIYVKDTKITQKGYEKDVHHKSGEAYIRQLEKDFYNNNFEQSEFEAICKIIRYHKGKKFFNKTFTEKEKFLINIIRISDKIAKLHKDKNETIDERKAKAQKEIRNSRYKQLRLIGSELLDINCEIALRNEELKKAKEEVASSEKE